MYFISISVRPDADKYQEALNEDIALQIVGGANPVTGNLRAYDFEKNQWKK